MLQTLGHSTLLPLYKKIHHYGGRLREYELPVFSEYVFCYMNRSEVSQIVRLPSVCGAVGVAGAPTPLVDEEIAALQAVYRLSVPLQPFPYLEIGSKVRVLEGSLKGVIGTVLETKNRTMTLVLSITLLRRSLLLEIERVRVEPVPEG
jgi:transcription antitermination factor NusG